MATEKAPVALTGAAGSEFEDCVAARFLIDLLQSRSSLGAEWGAVVRVTWQARESGWLADDLVLACQRGDLESTVALSLKRNRQVTSAGFPDVFRKLAWDQWDGRAGAKSIKGTRNAVGLVVGELAAEVEGAWNAVAQQVRESRSDLSRVLARLLPPTTDNPGSQASEVQRTLVLSLTREPACEPNVEALELIAQIRLLHLDFQAAASRQESLALADCRRLLASNDAAEAQALWPFLRGLAGRKRANGGTIELVELLAELRPQLRLNTHPDFVADWRALDRHSAESMDLVSNEIDELGTLERAEETRQAKDAIAGGKVAILLGDSGAGKSGLAKKVALESGAGVVWLGAADLDFDLPSQFERHVGLGHALGGVLAAAPADCLLVFDAVEKLSARGQRLAEQLLAGWAPETARQVAVVVTAQPEALGRIKAILAASGREYESAAVIAIDLPPQEQLDALTKNDPTVRRALNSGLRPVVRNLKVLDWVVGAARRGATVDETATVNVSMLIDWLWTNWIAGADNGDSRSALLMDIGVKESASLNAGVPRAALKGSQQPMLRGLEQDGALFRRHERLFFQHDLLADWARLRALMGESPVPASRWRELARNPRWHAALRLFGVWLLETDRIDLWERLEAEVRNAGDVSAGSLLLEAVLVASDPAGLIRRLWPLLVADDGARLTALLGRFLYVGTVPDPRLPEWGFTAQDVAAVEHAHRVPNEQDWLPILAELRAQAVGAARAAPIQVARTAGLFLQHIPSQIREGIPFPGRIDAAELAIAVVEELEGQRADGRFTWARGITSDGGDRVVFEALLRAAPDAPARVGELCLQLAQRRDWSDDLKARSSAAKVAADEQRRQFERSNPEIVARRAKYSSTAIPRGPLRDPWPDGPRRAVPESFRDACLRPSTFAPFAAALPEVALEVLLAVCIEEPQHDDPYNASHDDVGLAYWGESHPPLFFKGPFLQFLKVAPEQGLSFVLRLINFASKRQAQQPLTMRFHRARPTDEELPHIVVNVDGVNQQWFGEANCFEWHYWSPCGGMVVCVLQALERWLYEQLDADVDVSRWLQRLMRESESLALAGVLVDVGKRRIELLRGVLRPLLTVPSLYFLDQNAAHRRQRESPSEMMGWNGSAAWLFELAQEWYSAEHRKRQLLEIAVELCLDHEDMREFFGGLREVWRIATEGMRADTPLRLLAERLDPANWKSFRDAKGRLVRELKWPDEVQQAIAESERPLIARTALMGIPMRCRSILDSEAELPDVDRDAIWAAISVAERLEGEAVEDGAESFITATDAICAGIATLLAKCPRWLADDPSRLQWCRQQLQRTIDSPTGIGSWAEGGLGEWNWPSFVAQCGVMLLTQDPDDVLARQLVAYAATATQYAATAVLMNRAVRSRAMLGDDFRRLVTLGFEWCALRYKAHFRRLEGASAATDALKRKLVERFVAKELSMEFPSLLELNKLNRAEFHVRKGGSSTSLEMALDRRTLQAALGWLDLGAATTDAEREEWRLLLLQMLELVLQRVPADEASRHESSGPSEFDYWVLRTIAANLGGIGDRERERDLWHRVLDLGTPGYRWVDPFCDAWVENGTRSDWPRSWFRGVWSAMIDEAVASERWSSRFWPAYDLARNVIALLGLGAQGRRLFAGPEGLKLWADMLPAIERAQVRWFASAPVVQAFASFAVSVSHEAVLIAGVRWVHAAVGDPDFRGDDDVNSTLTEFLRCCWQTSRASIQADAELTTMFKALLAHVSASGQIAAATLRDQVLASVK